MPLCGKGGKTLQGKEILRQAPENKNQNSIGRRRMAKQLLNDGLVIARWMLRKSR